MNAPAGTPELCEAIESVRSALRDVDPDNPVAAVRVVAAVARRTRLPAATSWEAFRYQAEQLVAPYFEARRLPAAKAAIWAVVDPYFGQLGTGDSSHRETGTRVPTPRRKAAPVAVAGGAR